MTHVGHVEGHSRAGARFRVLGHLTKNLPCPGSGGRSRDPPPRGWGDLDMPLAFLVLPGPALAASSLSRDGALAKMLRENKSARKACFLALSFLPPRTRKSGRPRAWEGRCSWGDLIFPDRLGRGSPGMGGDLPWAPPAPSLKASLPRGSDITHSPHPTFQHVRCSFPWTWRRVGVKMAAGQRATHLGLDAVLDVALCWGGGTAQPTRRGVGGWLAGARGACGGGELLSESQWGAG